MAVVSFLVLGYTSEPSVPRFNPKFVNLETGGGYRRYPHLCSVYSLFGFPVSFWFGFPSL
ncbi:hypothetical protein B9T16_13620 [Arthrospira sp. PCC 8006]